MARKVRRVTAIAGAAAVAALVMYALGFGAGPLPALGRVLAARGVWESAAGAQAPRSGVLAIPGLYRPVTVSFTRSGIASIVAANDHDLFLAQGYVAAWFRLSQMDLERRVGEGRLSALEGPAAIGSDKFELRLGLLRTAEAQWAATPRSSPAGQALLAYARGVNDRIAELAATGQWPAIYTLAGVQPGPWTPVDSLVVQELLTQQLDFTTAPLDYSVLDRSLGSTLTARWFPLDPANAQRPYDPGPYADDGIAPLAAQNANADSLALTGQSHARPAAATTPVTAPAQAQAAGVAAVAIMRQIARLPEGLTHIHPDSNAWAVNGPLAGGSAAVLAGDPHLALSLPSYWYEVALRSPALDVAGASLPGIPAIVIGRNQHISWSLTDVQNQSTLFYHEQTSPSHPGEYLWRGAWRPVRKLRYLIPVRGAAPVRLVVDLTVHGPIMTTEGETTSVYWMGDIPSPDLAAILGVATASDWTQFTNALRGWRAPTQNFVYADDRGNIGVIAAGYYPVVRSGQPWRPLPGTGQSDVVGTIPFAALPRAYDPPGHVIVSANQRPVTAAYPYYIGTSQGFDPGYRAAQAYQALSSGAAAGLSGSAALQGSYADHLAAQIVPELLAALRGGAPLSPRAASAAGLLTRWNDSMDVTSPAATIWWTFWNDYLRAVFEPWWQARHVPAHLDPWNLSPGHDPAPLLEDLDQWTLHDQDNPAFSPPGRPGSDAPADMRAAFGAAVASLARRLGGNPDSWSWGRLHRRQIPSLLGAAALGYGPRPSGGDPWTVNAADDGMTSDFGPSLRMITAWSGAGEATSRAIYPGGLSENPASPWYQNLVRTWWSGHYLPIGLSPSHAAGVIVWTLRPEG